MSYGEESEGYDNAASEAISDPAIAEQSATPSESAQPEGTQNNWNAEEWALNVNGQRILPKSRDNVIQWANQGYNYSQRAAELNKKQKELDGLDSQYSQYKQLNEAFEKNPEFKNKIIELYQQAQQGTASQSEKNQVASLPPEILQKLSEVDEIKSEFQKLREEKEDKLLDQEISSLKETFKDENWDVDDGSGTLVMQILKKAHETGITDLKDVYKMLRFDHIRTNTEAMTKKQMAEQQMINAKKGIVSTSTNQKPVPRQFDTKTPWNKMSASDLLASVQN